MEIYRYKAVWRGQCTGLKPGVYKIHSKFRRTINVLSGDRLVGVGAMGTLHLPITIICDIPASYDMRKVKSSYLLVGNSLLKAPPLEVEVQVSPDRSKMPKTNGVRLKRLKRLILERLQSTDRGLSWYVKYKVGAKVNINPYRRFILRRIDNLVVSLKTGDPGQAISTLVGLGEGSTPSCDDMMMGVAAALHSKGSMLGKIILENMLKYAYNTTLLSRSLINCATCGYYCQEVVRLMSSEDPTPWVEKLIAAGGTSGVDILTGIFIGLDNG